MNKFQLLKKRNDIARFVSSLNDSDLESLENHLIKENYEIDNVDSDIESALLESVGSESLNEEVQNKLKVIFEAAVSEKTNAKVAAYIEEQNASVEDYANYVREELEATAKSELDELQENLDSYLDYVISEWTQENEIAIEESVKTQIAESVLNGIKRLFEDNYISVTDEEVNLVTTLENKNKKLYAGNIELHEQNRQLNEKMVDLKRRMIVEEMTKDLTLPQKDKILALVESINAKTSKEYKSQLEILIGVVKNEKNEPITESATTLITEGVEVQGVHPSIAKYLTAISKM